jgi:ABC-2 type transport system ATP-binding protein
MTDQVAISVTNVSKHFRLPHEKHSGLKSAILHFQPGKKYEVQRVLREISFDIKRGEFLGIVGRNGSGKSTLLKLLAQIYVPNHGKVVVNGSLTPFIELGVGFNPELTGRENVYLNGALLGFDRRQVNAMYSDIVEFAEIGQFMDQKLKNYSSGMQVRLAFSIAIRAKSDILLIDEVLAVGDAAFQQKCFNYFEQLKKQGQTIVFVSHDMTSVKQFCDKAILIDQGVIKQIGKPTDIAYSYDRLNYAQVAKEAVTETKPATKVEVRTLNHEGKKLSNFEYGQKIMIEAVWPTDLPVKHVGFVLSRGTETVFATNTFDQGIDVSGGKARLLLVPKLGNGRYRIMVGLFGGTRHDALYYGDGPEALVYNQPLKGDREEDWEGLEYIANTWAETS